MSLRARLGRITGRWVWRSPARAAALLESFQRAEASSMLDLLAAAQGTSSDARRALYLRHALDEDRHARSFATRARELRAQPRGGRADLRAADFDALYDRLGELGFLAFVHRGEQRGRAQFEAQRDVLRARGDERGSALFAAILVDEIRHHEYTGRLLLELAGSRRAARALLRKIAVREAWWGWRRAGRVIARLLFSVLSGALFVLAAPLALAYRLSRPVPRGWLPPESP